MKYVNVRQNDATDCAAATLATISLYYGLDISISRLRDICGTDIKGTNLNGLANGAKKLNFDVKITRINNEEFKKPKFTTLPLIAHVITEYGLSHFIVVYKITKKYVFIADPSKLDKKMKIDDFFKIYDGVCVILRPSNDFVGGKTKTGGILVKFLKLLVPQKKLFVSAIVSSVILTLLGIIGSFFNQILVDDILAYNLKNQLTIFCIGFLILSFIQIILGALRQHILLYLSLKIDIPLTMGYYKHIFSLPLKFFSVRKTGDIITRFQDAGTIKNILTGVALSILIDVTMVSAVGVVLYFMNAKLFVIVIILTIINIVLVYIFKQPYKKINLIQMEQGAKLNSSMIESLKGIEMIKSNSIEEETLEKIEDNFIDVVKTSFRENVLSNVQGTISGAIGSIGNLTLMWAGAMLVLDSNITLGALLTFTAMTKFFMDPIGRLVGLQLQIQESSIAMKRLTEIYDYDVEQKGNKLENISLKEDINFSNVTFRYGSRQPVISDVSLEIKNGEKVAIVGESGSGKTTLLKLLMGLYEIEEGEIKIGDTSVYDISFKYLRSKIAHVSQNVELFSGSITDNFKIIDSNISSEDIKKASKLAGCDFINKLPGGYDTFLDEAGTNLSGGERQKLALARALVKDFDILILDEATSNLDFISEAKIYNTLFNSNLCQTMLIIAHRLSTIRSCDRIIVMDKGKIIEIGTHDELLKQEGHYKKLWISQVGSDEAKNSSPKKKKLGDEIEYE